MAASKASRQQRTRDGWRIGAVLAFVLALYGQTAAFDFSYLDDDILIIDDQSFLSASGSVARAFTRGYFPPQRGSRHDHEYYRPLVTASYALDAYRAGTAPGAYHLTNVLLHAGAAALLFLLLRRRFGYPDNLALFGALLFAAHPALTEAVAWIPGRNDALLAVFALTAWLLLPAAHASSPSSREDAQQPSTAPARTTASGVLSTLAHLLAWLGALFTKETGLILPLVWIAQLHWLERRSWRAVLRPALVGGWLVTFAAYLAARATLTATAGQSGPAVPSLWSGLSLTRMVSNLPLLLGAFGKLLIPVHLSVLAIPADTWLWTGVVGAVAVLLATRFLPDVRRAHVLFGLWCVVAFLLPGLPASNLLVLENRLYLCGVGLALVVCEIGRAAPVPARPKTALAAAVIGALAAASFSYSGDFKDRLAFARAAAAQSPHSSLAHRNLGVAYHVAGDSERARHEYQAALAEDAAEPVAHNNLGVLLMAQGQLAEAERELTLELDINSEYAPAHHNLAQVLNATGRVDQAARHWERSLTLNPKDSAAIEALAAYHAARDPAPAGPLRRQLDRPGVPAPVR